MWGTGRERRPVEFGPYPLERLARDPSILEKEAAIPPREPEPIDSGGSVSLVEAVKLHLGVASLPRSGQITIMVGVS